MLQNKEEKKSIYALYIMRRDENHIIVIESSNYDKVYELYKNLTENWELCVKNQKPFSINEPVVTTFDPGLIYEITVRPVVVEQNLSKYDNPYQKKMLEKGLGNTFPTSSILDNGYL
jgi:hypothetical protein